jgi:hypothetical protein
MPFNVSELVVTHSYHYSSFEYLAYCAENEEEPTEQGFYDYILPEINEDFPSSSWHPYTVVKSND